MPGRRNLQLLAHAGFMGSLPILLVGFATRLLPVDQLFIFFQLWALFNVVSLAVFGTVEALSPRVLGSPDGDAGQLSLYFLALPVSIFATIGYLLIKQVALSLEVLAGMLILSLSYAAYSAVRGRLIFRGNWSGMARGAFFQLVTTLSVFLTLVELFGGRLAFIFLSLIMGYLAFIVANSRESLELLQSFALWRDVGAMFFERSSISSFSFLGFVASAVLTGAVPALPVILASNFELEVEEVAILVVVTYLVKISVSLSNAFTPLVLNLYESGRLRSHAISRTHSMIFLIPGLFAVGITAIFSQLALPLYLGFPVNIEFTSALFLSAAELLFALAVVPRTLEIAKGGSRGQIFSWGAGGLFLLTAVMNISLGNMLMNVSVSLLGTSIVVILLQWFFAKGKNSIG